MSVQRRIDLDELRRLARDGLSGLAISRRLGFSDSSVYSAAKRHGVALPEAQARIEVFWRERHDEMLALRAAGLSVRAIAAQLGTTKNAVIGRLHRLGMLRANGARKDSEFWARHDGEIERLKASGLTEPQIAAQLGVSRSAINSRRMLLKKRREAERAAAADPVADFLRRRGARVVASPEQVAELLRHAGRRVVIRESYDARWKHDRSMTLSRVPVIDGQPTTLATLYKAANALRRERKLPEFELPREAA